MWAVVYRLSRLLGKVVNNTEGVLADRIGRDSAAGTSKWTKWRKSNNSKCRPGNNKRAREDPKQVQS